MHAKERPEIRGEAARCLQIYREVSGLQLARAAADLILLAVRPASLGSRQARVEGDAAVVAQRLEADDAEAI